MWQCGSEIWSSSEELCDPRSSALAAGLNFLLQKSPSKSNFLQVPRAPVVIELESGDRIESQLLVGADGAQSLVRKSLGRDKDMLAWQYHQMGLVASLQISSDEPNVTAWQRFLPSGPIALLPLGPTSSSLVWTVPKAELQSLLNMKDEVILLLTTAQAHFYFLIRILWKP